MAGVRITSEASDEASWNSYVETNAGSTVFHLLQWRRIITRAYGHEAYYVYAEDGGVLQGILPLFLIRSRLFGRALVSVPFADYGGICAAGPIATRALLEEALKIAAQNRADYLQLRHRQPLNGVSGVPLDKVTMLLALESDPEKIWAALPSERRNRIKKARRMGVVGRMLGAEGVESFYRVLAQNMRDIGSPIHSRAFFEAITKELGSRVKVLLVERSTEVIGAALCLFHRGTLYIPWVSSLRRRFDYNPNMVLYWTAIEHACLNGYRLLDFGRSSKGSGTLEFKRQWGAQPLDLGWTSFPLNGKLLPTFSGEALKERVFIECWKRLPVGVSRVLGPWLRAGIPA